MADCKTLKTVADVMTKDPVVLEEWENLLDVAEDMKQHHLRHLPVVDDGKLIGLVSHRDLLRFTATVLDSSMVRDSRDQHIKESTFVREVMTRDVTTVSPGTPIKDAVNTLVESRFGCLPVVDRDQRLVGILSEHDLLQLLAQLLNGVSKVESA